MPQTTQHHQSVAAKYPSRRRSSKTDSRGFCTRFPPRWLDLHAFGIAFLGGVFLWVAPALEREGLGYLLAVVKQRDITTGAAGWARPPWWYLGPLFTVTMPAGALVPVATVRAALRRLYSPSLVMAAVIVVALSLVPGKRDYYLLPAFPFLALTSAETLGQIGRPGRSETGAQGAPENKLVPGGSERVN